jgi:aryl sulfotransferase
MLRASPPAGVALEGEKERTMSALPERTRVYQNHHLDSTRWDGFQFRPDDIVISTSYKAGTTWMQTIVANLLFQDGDLPGPITSISPWLDNRIRPVDDLYAYLESQQHRRFIKSHLALDGLRFDPQAKYIVVGRDPRDVFMSLYNHYSGHTPRFMKLLNFTPGRVGPPLPEAPEDINWLWRQWISLGWFEWESDGWPYWSHLHHAKTWWPERERPNVLLVHYNDLLADLDGEMRRVAAFLDIDVPEDAWPRLVDAATFDTMKANADQIMPAEAEGVWEGGAQRFLYKGTNRRWDGVLTDDELAMYPRAMERTLEPDAAEWLERGRLVTTAAT